MKRTWLQRRAWLNLFGVLLGGVFGPQPLQSATSPVNIDGYTVEAWQVEDGLPQSSVSSIVQTPDGYLWLATFNGLVRFDGVRFKVFDDGNTPGLESSRLVRLDTDQRGRLWIISEEGALSSFAEGKFRKYSAAEGLPKAGAAGLARGPQGRVLLLDRAGRVSEFSGERFVPGPSWPFLEGGPASLFTDDREQLWVWLRQKRNLGLVVADRMELLKHPGSEEAASVRAFALSRRGGLWVVLSTAVWHYDSRSGWEPTQWTLPETVRALTCILEDRRGNLWISTYGHGLLRCDPSGTCEQFTAGRNGGLTRNALRALLEDREGSLWVGTDGGGLNRLKPRLVSSYGVQHGLTAPVVMSVAEDTMNPGTLWLGLNGGGVNRFRSGQATPFISEPLLSSNSYVYCVFPDHQGNVWVGNYDLGILRLHHQELTRLSATENWSGKPLLVGLEDKSGTVWLGGGFGLLRWNNGQYTNLNQSLGWADVAVRALTQDRDGNIYIGSSEGLARWDGAKWSRYGEKEGLPDKHLTALCIDQNNALWIGSVNGGLTRFKGGRFTSYSTRDGLPANSITSVLEDHQGNLWLGSNRGLFRVGMNHLEQFAPAKGRLIAGLSYGMADGLGTLECGAACRAQDGNLWFATASGLALVNPGSLPVNTLVPPVVIEDALIDGQNATFRPGKEFRNSTAQVLVVPAGVDRVQFQFTGLSYLAPEKVRFRYRLEGYDRQWLESGVDRAASYTHLPPGQYRFQVTACNNDGIWNQAGAMVGVVVLPPWWMTWWFRVTALAVISLVLFWAVEARVRRVQREHKAQKALSRRLIETQEAERKRIAAELHDSLGQNLLVIKNRALLGLQDTAATARSTEQLGEISRIASATLAEVREISHDLRPYQLDRLGLTKALHAMVSSVSAASGLPCVARIDSLDGQVAAAMEIHCYRVVQELLNNLVKHSHASEARVSARLLDARIVLEIQDDGCGFDVLSLRDPTAGHGMGLSDVAERVRILGGTLSCQSQRAKGTRWTIQIPTTPPANS